MRQCRNIQTITLTTLPRKCIRLTPIAAVRLLAIFAPLSMSRAESNVSATLKQLLKWSDKFATKKAVSPDFSRTIILLETHFATRSWTGWLNYVSKTTKSALWLKLIWHLSNGRDLFPSWRRQPAAKYFLVLSRSTKQCSKTLGNTKTKLPIF